MSSSMLVNYGGLYAIVARFIARQRREPRLPLNVEEVITAAYRRIDEQDAEIKRLTKRDELREVEVELLQSEMQWMNRVLRAADIVLSDYDYLRLQQVAVKVRVLRSR